MTKKKNSKKKKIIIIAIILILCILLMIVIVHKKNDVEIINNEKIYFTPDEIIDLLSYIPHSPYTMNYYKDAYNGELVITDEVLSSVLFTTFIKKYSDSYTAKNVSVKGLNDLLKKNNIEDGTVFSKTDISDYILKCYNLNLDSFDDLNSPKYVILDNKYFVFTSFDMVNEFLVYGSVFISVNEAYAINGEGIVTERKVFIVKKNDKWYVYKNSDINNNDNIIKVYDSKDSNGNELSYDDIVNKIKEDFKDYNYEFKHTFKKNKTGYYYYSTELEEVKKSRLS